MRLPITLLAIIAILFSVAQPATTFASQTIQPGMPWYGPTSSWNHNDYSVKRYAVDQTQLQHTLGGTELRRAGYLPLTNTSSDLFLFNIHTNRLYETGYVLPTIRWCNACSTSSGMNSVSLATVKDGRLVVLDAFGGNVSLLDPATLTSTVWLNIDTNSDLFKYNTPIAQNNTLYLTHPNNPYKSIYRVSTPNTPVADESVSLTLPTRSPVFPTDVLPDYLMLTDYEGGYGSTVVGQVGTGVYVYMINYGPFKIGYTGSTTRSTTSFITRQEPRLLDRTHVAWIGADHALYVADTAGMNGNAATGLLDIPRGVPFKAASSPEVYYHDIWSYAFGSGNPAMYNFENEADYYSAMNTTDFRRVVTLPDAAVDHQELQNQILETNKLIDWTTFREYIYAQYN